MPRDHFSLEIMELEPKESYFTGDEYFFDDQTAENSDRYLVLSEVNVRQRMEKHIRNLQTAFSITRSAAIILLFHHKWDIDRFTDAWVTDEDAVFTKLGLLDKGKPKSRRFGDENDNADLELEFDMGVICAICFESFVSDDLMIYSASCGHPFCKTCWGSYFRDSVSSNGWYEILMLKCPEPSCKAVVGEELFDELCSNDDDKEKFWGFLVDSYIEQKKDLKRCPSPNCGHLVSLIRRKNGLNGSICGCEDVRCVCFHKFCWDCLEEAHNPVDCGAVAKWTIRNHKEMVNFDFNWIKTFTKACPGCKQSIQNVGGSINMVCNCGFEFCWECVHDWGDHANHELMECYQSYYEDKVEGWFKRGVEYSTNEGQEDIEEMKEEFQLYDYCYEEWDKNESLLKIDLEKLRDYSSDTYMKEAWTCIIDCRRILKWSYVYKFYMTLSNEDADDNKINYFKYFQYLAAARLLELYEFVERVQTPSFMLRGYFVGMVRATREFFDDFVKSLERGLPEVEPHHCSNHRSNIKGEAGDACGARN